MASSSSTELLSVGKQCSQPLCQIVDFLPFKCQHCKQSFCQDHFKVDAHKCPQYDESKHNRVAPNCPLCNTPVAVKQGQDPNIRMDQHLERECSVVTGRVQAKSTPVCARQSCKKVLFSPIRCDKCREQFCPAHRFPNDHTCNPVPPTAPTASAQLAKHSTNLMAKIEAGTKDLNAKATTAVKKAASSASAASTSVKKPSSTPATTSSEPKKPLPFSKMDRPPSSSTTLHNAPAPTTLPLTNVSPPTLPTTPTPTPPLNDPSNKPEPIIDPMAFVPRPLFGFA